MSTDALIKKLERELELNRQLATAKQDNLKETLSELMRNPDIKAQAAKELQAIKSGPRSQRPKVDSDGSFNRFFESDSEIQPLNYDDEF